MEEFYTQIALFSGETKSDRNAIKNGIKVLTIHSSKGLEYENVFLPFWNQGTVPMIGFPNFGEQEEQPGSNEEEERRVAFVGITRAKQFVQISCHRMQTLYDGR